MLKYCLTAAGLGLGWFVVLLLPAITREWLLEKPGLNIALLVVASMLTALAGRRYIDRADTFGGHLARAVLMPYAGTVLFLTSWNAVFWFQTLAFGGLANVHDTFSLYLMGLTAVTLSCYVVIPYGLFCQFAMQWASRP